MTDSLSSELDSSSKRKWRADAVRLTIGILESEKDYRNLCVLGRGTYGDVFRMYDPHRDCDIAVKVVTSDNLADIETAVWPKLRHPNIVPLLEVHTFSPVDTVIFVMPVQYKTLHDVLQDKYFRKREGCLMYIKAWLYEVLCGLEYLNSRNLCHLDIKVDNVLITHKYTAMLCDFSFVNYTSRPLEKYDLGLPYIYRPPEACHSLGETIKVDGISYDMWGYGVMVVEIFTQFVLANTVSNEKCWYKEVYPTLFQALQEKQFKKEMAETFPADVINTGEIRLALNFIHLFLKQNYEKRATPSKAKKHQFLGEGTDLGPVPDPMWIYKGAVKPVLKTIVLQEFESSNEDDYASDLSSADASEEDMVRLKTSEEEIFENLMDRRCGLRYRRTPGIKHSKHACKDTKSLKDHSTDPKFKSDDSSEEGKIGNKLLRKEMTHKSKFPKSKFANQFLSCCSSANPEFEDGKYALLEEKFELDLPGTIRKIKDFNYTPEDSELISKFEEISPERSEIKTKRERVLFKGSRINIEKGETSPGGSEVKTKSEGSLSKRSSTITKFVDESPEEIAEEEDISPKERKVKFESKQTSYFGSTLPEEIDESNIESSPDQSSAEESVLNVTSSTSTVSTDSVSVKSIVENEEWYQKCEHESNIEIAAYVSESDIQKIHHGEKRAENVIEACESHIRSINHDGKLTEKNAEADKNCTSLATGDNIISCSAQIKNSPLSLSQILPAGELSDESTQGSFKSYSEVYEEVKRLQSRMNELDQKINELTSTLSCENLSANKRLENLTGARPKVKLQNERINYEISEPNLVIESTMSEALANIEEVKRTLEVVELDNQEPELYEDQFDNLCHNSSTAGLLLLEDSNRNQVESLGSTTRNNERKCGDEEIQRHRKILHWLRKRYSRFEKMLKSIPSKVMK